MNRNRREKERERNKGPKATVRLLRVDQVITGRISSVFPHLWRLSFPDPPPRLHFHPSNPWRVAAKKQHEIKARRENSAEFYANGARYFSDTKEAQISANCRSLVATPTPRNDLSLSLSVSYLFLPETMERERGRKRETRRFDKSTSVQKLYDNRKHGKNHPGSSAT